MRRLLVFLFALPVGLLLGADPKSLGPANTLTKAEAADGWLLLFDGRTTFGWKVDGEARVEGGVLILGGEKATRAEPTAQLGPHKLSFEASWQGKAPLAVVTGSSDKLSLAPAREGAFAVHKATVATGRPASPLRFDIPAGERLLLRNVKAQPQGLQPIFNGKDLRGWKEHSGKKSKFTVTSEGWLNVKNGPGDLQTEGLYDDFVLQLECISNGKHLNSGIFFRAIPGEYQQGYEAQIRNEFKDKADQTYTIEHYDPKTNKLLGKETVLSPAVDFGTGAIYRRVPARPAGARDGEWFTLTLIARGRHLSTWVNGIQATDWVDNRPAADNGRRGYRAEKGALSIQGHDPTTDLSFRNLRVAPLPRAEK